METIKSTLRELEAAKKILAHHGDSINNGELASITHDGLAEIDAGMGLSKTAFAQISPLTKAGALPSVAGSFYDATENHVLSIK